MLRFKTDVLPMLKAIGYNTVRIRKEAIFGGATVNKMRHRQIVSMNELARVCDLLKCQPGDLIEYVDDSKEKDPA